MYDSCRQRRELRSKNALKSVVVLKPERPRRTQNHIRCDDPDEGRSTSLDGVQIIRRSGRSAAGLRQIIRESGIDRSPLSSGGSTRTVTIGCERALKEELVPKTPMSPRGLLIYTRFPNCASRASGRGNAVWRKPRIPRRPINGALPTLSILILASVGRYYLPP